jgi:hypothetical protein
MTDVIVSIATIPVRVQNGCLARCIKALLNQSIEVKKIYVNVPYIYKRFGSLSDHLIEYIKRLSDKVEVLQHKVDSPIIKYFGAIHHCEQGDKNDYVFVGDDDQEYHPLLLEKMREGIYDSMYVYQNRYHIVKHGTGGIIHGFVGLMFQARLLKGEMEILESFRNTWIDDQVMSMLFAQWEIPIVPSPVNDFDDIYLTLNSKGMEQLGMGGDLALSKETSDRAKQINKLEKDCGCHFVMKNHPSSKGECFHLFDLAPSVIHLVKFNKMTDENWKRYETIFELCKRLPVTLNVVTLDDIESLYIEIVNDSTLEFLEDVHAIKLLDSQQGLYLSLKHDITEDTILDLLCLRQNKMLYKNGLVYFSRFIESD